MQDLARFPQLANDNSQPTVSVVTAKPDHPALKSVSALMLVVNAAKPKALKDTLPSGQRLSQRLKKAAYKSGVIVTSEIDNKPGTKILAICLDTTKSHFDQMTEIRKLASQLLSSSPSTVALATVGFPAKKATELSELAIEAILVANFKLPSYASNCESSTLKKIRVFGNRDRQIAKRAFRRAGANNLARWLGALPPNKLDTRTYRQLAAHMARTNGWQHRFYSINDLKKLGAGAFIAVAQGNADNDAGIVRLSYKPRHKKRVALVGKGIIFDTGGNNLKPFKGMLNMHIDMQGSAVALATLAAVSEARLDMGIDCWLALSENRLSATAYKSQDVITALNGKTIQTIHTDAEGRMVLADTLTLAARRKPALIMDFATLTGACVTAATSRYSGVFTNRPKMHAELSAIGEKSGERVWPFPIGSEFDEDLKSETADLLQCSVDGSGDHILAAQFLNNFVPDSIPWVHMDLSAAERSGGLGLVPTELTGFGTRYALQALSDLDKLLNRANHA